mgnify:CR=1 FL=1
MGCVQVGQAATVQLRCQCKGSSLLQVHSASLPDHTPLNKATLDGRHGRVVLAKDNNFQRVRVKVSRWLQSTSVCQHSLIDHSGLLTQRCGALEKQGF